MKVLWIAVLLLMPGQLVPPSVLLDRLTAQCRAEMPGAMANVWLGTTFSPKLGELNHIEVVCHIADPAPEGTPPAKPEPQKEKI